MIINNRFMKLLTRSFLIIGLLIFGTQTVLAVTLDACTPQAILDYSGQNIPAGSNCTLESSTGVGVPFSFTTPNFGASTPAFSLPVNTTGSNLNYTYTLACQGSGATSSAVTFTVPPNTGCAGPAQYKCNSGTSNQCAVCTAAEISSGQCSGGTSCTGLGQNCSGGVYTPPGGGTTKYQCTGGAGSSCGTCVEGGTSPTCSGTTYVTQSACAAATVCSPVAPRCGDRVIDSGEQCDNGDGFNGVNGNSCSATCQNVTTGPLCGNGVVNAGESCGEPGLSCNGSDLCSACSCYTPGAPRCSITTTNNQYSGYAVGATPSAQVTLEVFSPGDLARYFQVYGATNYFGGAVAAGAYGPQTSTITLNPLQAGTNTVQVRDGNTVMCSQTFDAVSTQPINIGFDTSYTRTKSTPALANETVYVTTGGRTGCSVSGNFTSVNTAGINMPVGSNPSFVMDSGYAVVGRSAGSYPYTLSCPGVTPVTATLTVTSPTSDVSCDNSPRQIVNGSTSFSWSTRLVGSTCTVSPSTSTTFSSDQTPTGANGTLTVANAGSYVVTCSTPANVGKGELGLTGSATCVATAENVQKSGWECTPSGSTGPCSACGGSTGVECTTTSPFGSKAACELSSSNQCGNSVPLTLGAICATNPGITYSPNPAVAGKSFNLSFGFINSGTESWNAGSVYQAKSISSIVSAWNNIFVNLPNSLAGGSGLTQSPYFSTALNAPAIGNGVATASYPLEYVMTKNGNAFGTTCEPVGTVINIRNTQCNDGIDNEDPEDNTTTRLADCADPACWTGGAVGTGSCNRALDTENDPVPGVVLKISANPQLVRQGGNSAVSYEVKGCSVGGIAQAWTLKRDGSVTGIQGVGSAAPGSLSVNNIQAKTTYTLMCGNTSRSATISVIKINEF